MAAVTKGVKIRCYPNPAQVRMLSHWFGCSRWLWNWSLESRKKSYERRKESVSGIDISRRLTKLKKLDKYSWLQKPPATCLTQTLRDQDKAFANFFRRVKSGEKPGYPKFRKRGYSESLRFQDVSLPNWIKGVVSLTKLGRIKTAESLPDCTCPNMVTLKREADGRYYITFMYIADPALMPVSNQAIGVDLGLTHLATLSSGEKIENPKKYHARLRYLRQQQRCLSRRQKGSNRYQRQRLRVAKVHSKVKNQRNNYTHNLTTKLVRGNQVIAIEDLKVKNMIQHPHLARHIADAGWSEIRRQLEYKCTWYGRTLIVVDQWFPSSKTCSGCGHKLDVMRLDIRQWTCPKCGKKHDRDINAAQNLLTAAMRQLSPREGGDLRVEAAVVNAASEARTGQLNLEHARFN